eukprot:gene17596-20992_t
MKILIIEDEQELLKSIASYLNGNAFICEQADNIYTAREKLKASDYDCVVLDITLPVGSGMDILRELKLEHKSCGVLIISAKGSLDDKLTGLELGADDYLTKPFHLPELAARIHAIHRRRVFGGSDLIEVDKLSLNIQDKYVRTHLGPVELTRKEFELLMYFISNKNRVVTKEAIIDHLWGAHSNMPDNYDLIYVHIRNLRKKLIDKGCPDYINAVGGIAGKPMKFLSMYNRYNVSVMVIVFALSSVVSFFLIKEVLKNEMDGSLLRVKAKIASYVNDHKRLPEVSLLNDEQIEFKKTNQESSSDVFKSVRSFVPGLGRIHFCRQLSYSIKVQNQFYVVRIVNPLEGTSHLTKLILCISLITIVLLLVTTFMINRLIISKLWQPFYQSMTALGNFKVSDTQQPDFPVTKISEFNFMIGRLRAATTDAGENYRILKEFTENAAHEIQTPLAIIQSKLDLLVQQQMQDEHLESLRSAYGAIRKLSRINQDLLLITKIENSQFKKEENTSVKDKVEEKLKEFREIWQLKNLQLETELKDAGLTISPQLLDILIYNVFGNATKHNRNGGFIRVKLNGQGLSVANSGPAKALNKERLFSRFYKENNNAESNGLGLSIIKQICEVSGIEAGYRYDENTHEFYFVF